MKGFLTLLCLLVLVRVAFSQANPGEDSVRLTQQLERQRFYYEQGKYDSALTFARNAIPLAIRTRDVNKIARAYGNIGLVYTQLTQYDSANANLDRVDMYAKQLTDSTILVAAYTTRAILTDSTILVAAYTTRAMLANYQSDYETAVEALMNAVQMIESSKSLDMKNMLARTYGHIGHNLIAEKQILKGIEYEKKALAQRNYPSEARYRVLIHLDIFDAFATLGQLQEAKQHLDSAVEENRPLNNIVLSAIVANNQGIYFNAVKDLKNAQVAFKQSYDLAAQVNNDFLKAEAADNLAQTFFKDRSFASAEKYALEANAIARRLSELKTVAGTYKTLSDISSHQNDFKRAFDYAMLYKRYADSATNQETQKAAIGLESRYQHQKRQREIDALTAKNVVQELTSQKQMRLLTGGAVIFVALIVILLLFYRNSKQRQLVAEAEQKLQQEKIKFLERQQQVVSLQSMINGQETERTRIARDLHDGLGGLFSTVKMYLSTLEHNNPQLAHDELFQKGYNIINTASVEVRRIAHNMMPEVLMKLGLVNALKDLCDSISAGRLLKVTLEVHGMNARLNATTEIMLFRIVQELLNNIIKHAQATEVIIQCVRDQSRLSLIVEDNGKGFNTEAADTGIHSGIEAVKNRVDYLKGTMTIDSQKNLGTTVMMDFLIHE